MAVADGALAGATADSLMSLLTEKEKGTVIILLDKLTGNGQMIKRFSTSHITRMKRLCPILGKKDYIAHFEQIVNELEWSPSTAKTYFETILSIKRELQLAMTTEDKHYLARIATESAGSPSWMIDDPTQVLTTDQCHKLKNLAEMHPAFGAAWVTLVLGQRMSDVLQLLQANIFRVAADTLYLAVTFESTKTSSRVGPYSLAVATGSFTAKVLERWSKQSATEKVFDIAVKTAERIVTMQFKIDIRALRRTGLQNLSNAGADTQQLLQFSRHTSVAMLNLYLFRGALNVPQAMTQIGLVERAEHPIIPAVQRWARSNELSEV